MRMMSTLVVEDHDDFKTYYFALALNSDSNRGGRDRGGEKNREKYACIMNTMPMDWNFVLVLPRTVVLCLLLK